MSKHSPVKRKDGGASPPFSASRFLCIFDEKREKGKDTFDKCFGKSVFCRMCHAGYLK